MRRYTLDANSRTAKVTLESDQRMINFIPGYKGLLFLAASPENPFAWVDYTDKNGIAWEPLFCTPWGTIYHKMKKQPTNNRNTDDKAQKR